MASKRIAGITIELNGDTTDLNKSLKGVDSELRTVKSSLKDVDKLLKLDPENVILLEQKQKLLSEAVENTTKRLDTLKDALTDDLPPDKYEALQREIIATQNELDTYKGQLDEAAGSEEDLADEAGGAAEDVSDLGDETEDAGSSAEEASEKWTAAKQILADLVTAGIKAAIEGLGELISKFSEAMEAGRTFADEMLTLSVQTGLSTETLQEYAYMAELIDVPLDTVIGSMEKLKKAMIQSKDGTGAAAEAFNELGVGYRLSGGDLRDWEAVFYDTIDALGEIEDPLKADEIAMSIFGKSFKDLKPLVAQGSKGLAEYRQEAHEMGAVLDEEALSALGAVDDAYQRLDQSSQALERQLALALAPAFEEIYTKLTEFTQDESWQETFETIGEIVQELVPILGDVLGLLSPMFEILSPIFEILAMLLEPIAELISAVLEPLVGVLGEIIEPVADLLETLLPPLVSLVETLVPLLEPIGELLGAVLTVLEPITPILEILIAALELVVGAIVDGVSPAVEALAALLQGDFSGALEAITDGISDAADNWKTRWSNMKTVGEKAMTSLMDSMSTWTTNFRSSFSDALDSMKTTLTGWGTSLKTKFTDAFDSAKDIISKALEVIKGLLDGSLSFPSIKLPHISISGSLSLNPPSVPKFSIDWYRKAMDKGMILNSPTIFGAMNGKLLGGGEAGSETVVGTNSLMGMIQGAVNNSITNMGGVTVVVNAAKGQDVNAIADAVESKLNARYLRKVAVQR